MSPTPITVRTLEESDGPAAVEVVSQAADWYREFLPPEEVHGPEMTFDHWLAEAQRMTWFGAFDGDRLIGVIGLEYVRDAALFRHAYVLPQRQRQGVAALLHAHVEGQVQGAERIIAGTYVANYKARAALEKAGYRRSPDSEVVLRRYYQIPEERLTSSVTYEKAVGP